MQVCYLPESAGRSAKVSLLPSASATIRKLKGAGVVINIAPFQNCAERQTNGFYIDTTWEGIGKLNLW